MAPSHIGLRVVMTVAALGLTLLPFTVSGGMPAFAAALVVLTVVAVARPESIAVLVLLVGQAFHWTTTAPVPERLPQWLAVLCGAWLALLVHATASAAVTAREGPDPSPGPAALGGPCGGRGTGCRAGLGGRGAHP